MYQPDRRRRDGRVTGVEALLRWAHPSRGVVAPGLIVIPLAEQSGLIDDIGRWVLDPGLHRPATLGGASTGRRPRSCPSTCRSSNSWPSASPTPWPPSWPRPAPIPSLAHPRDHRERFHRRPGTGARSCSTSSKHIGVFLALDDFGTGYASLALPQPVPVRHRQDRPGFRRRPRQRGSQSRHRHCRHRRGPRPRT